jgi:hypothetical protein
VARQGKCLLRQAVLTDLGGLGVRDLPYAIALEGDAFLLALLWYNVHCWLARRVASTLRGGWTERDMDFLPYYVLAGVAVGFLVVLVLQNLKLALEYLLMVGRVVIVLFLLMLLGWLFGWWELPRPMAVLIYGLRRLWEPFQRDLLEWFRSLFRQSPRP